MDKVYIAIDLKSFYASVECVARGLDPLTECLVVADKTRTEKTICLAVSPALKSFSIPGRARLFEVVSAVDKINSQRKYKNNNKPFSGSSTNISKLKLETGLALDYIVAPPRMAEYMKISTEIYKVYLQFIAPEDIHVYSIDEVFIDATKYLDLYKCTPHELTMKLVNAVLDKTGITATAGIGTNLYLCKIAMDIEAKHMPPDKNGVRIAYLDEELYRKKMWNYKPITAFWRIGHGIATTLEKHGIYTMGDIAKCSVSNSPIWNEDLLYRLFGVNAELIIDHAWGYEPCTIADIKSYKPQAKSVSTGQVLSQPYEFDKARLIAREMTDLLVLDLVDKGLVADKIVLTVGYDINSVKNFNGEIQSDRYGRKVPKQAHGTIRLGGFTSSTKVIIDKTLQLFDEIVNPDLQVRRMYVVADNVKNEAEAKVLPHYEQLSLFTDYEKQAEEFEENKANSEKEKNIQKAIIKLQKKYGKNAVLKGFNFEEGATTKERNETIGGHKA